MRIFSNLVQVQRVFVRSPRHTLAGLFLYPLLQFGQVILAVEPGELIIKFMPKQCNLVKAGPYAIVDCHQRIFIRSPMPDEPFRNAASMEWM